MSSWDLQIQGADDMLPTIEVDCADSYEAAQLCLQAIQRGLAGLTGGKKSRRVTVYVYEGPSINFRRPTKSIWFGIAGPERLLTVLHAALSSVPGTDVRFGG